MNAVRIAPQSGLSQSDQEQMMIEFLVGDTMQKISSNLSLILAMALCASVGQCFADPFADGDTVVFFGDSITHGGLYHKYIADFYLTRYPERKIRFVNSGIGGDTAGGAMKRIPEDIAEYDPAWVVFHFGMNDVDRGAYSDDANASFEKRRAAAYERYCRNFDELVRKVSEAAPRAKFIYMTPTPYDDTAVPTNMPPNAAGWAIVNQKGCSVALSMMAGHVLEKAARDRVLGIDLYSPLQNYLVKRRRNDPHFMLTRWDRVHPDALGHSIMAWTFLKAQGVEAVVCDVSVDAGALAVRRCANAEVSGLAVADGGVDFTMLEKSLPLPVDTAALPVANEFDVVKSLNSEVLSVTGLAPGVYVVSIDGVAVGEWTSEALTAGVNLAFAASAPQYAQSRKVFNANERNREKESVLRNHHSARWFYYGKADVDDVGAFSKWMSARREKGYFASFVPGYLTYWPRYREVREELLGEQKRVYAIAMPVPHRYSVRLVKSKAKP